MSHNRIGQYLTIVGAPRAGAQSGTRTVLSPRNRLRQRFALESFVAGRLAQSSPTTTLVSTFAVAPAALLSALGVEQRAQYARLLEQAYQAAQHDLARSDEFPASAFGL